MNSLLSLLNFRKNRTSFIDKKQSIEETGYVVIDTELTGLNEKKDSIVSIGAVKMTGGRINLGDIFYRLISPASDLTAESVLIHEITPADVLEKPEIGNVLEEFLEFCGSDIIVGYCVDIDMEFINREAKKLFGINMQNPVLDIFPLYEWLRNRERINILKGPALPVQHKLYDIAKHFGIAVNGAHNAMIDAFITAQIFQRLVPMFAGHGRQRLDDLLRTGNPDRGGDRRLVGGMSNF